MSESERGEEFAGAVNHWPGGFIPASADQYTDNRLAPHRDLDQRGIPEINSYNPSDCWYMVFHEVDDTNDPLGNAFILAAESTVVDTEDYR